MTTMPNISLTKRELNNLVKKSFYTSGGESFICQPTRKTLYKLFRQGKNIIPMSDNKAKKVTRLYELQLEDSIRPLSTISCNGELFGYEMTYDRFDEKYSPYKHTREERIDFLFESKRILEYFASLGIVYGDVAYRNILFNTKTGRYKFCDMDNIQIEGHPIDLIGNTTPLATYESVCGVDSKADAYVHNIMTFKTLGVEFPSCFEDELELDFESQACRIVDSMETPQNFTGEYVIEYVKRR